MQKPIVAAIARIDDDAWVDIDDDIGARAQVAETLSNGRRLIVRRTLNESDHPTMFEDWRHHAFLTNQPGGGPGPGPLSPCPRRGRADHP